jgi:hypothetical protein
MPGFWAMAAPVVMVAPVLLVVLVVSVAR